MKSSLIQKWFYNARTHHSSLRNHWYNMCNNWCVIHNSQISRTTGRIKKKACIEWKTDYRKHSLEYGEIIHDTWLNPSRLASCQYRNGKLEHNQAMEPSAGLALTHLVIGYPAVWKLYRYAVAESTEICNSIEKTIISFESRVTSTIEAETAEYSLHRRDIAYSPKKCDDLHYYVDRNIFETVFECVEERIENKSLRPMEIEHGTFNIDDMVCPHYSLKWRAMGLGSGTNEEIIELERRIKSLIDCSNILDLVEEYNKQSEKLQNSQLKKSYRDSIERIWSGIRDNGEMLGAPGLCENIKECSPRP